jgi:mannose-6-phosphate isomerase-like protein (cupin superfamily)
MLTDVTLCGDRNMIKKEIEKIMKYRSLKLYEQFTRNAKTGVTAVIIIGPDETISTHVRHNVQA